MRVRCARHWHEVAIADGAFRLADHTTDEVRREQALRALGGTSSGCFAARDQWTSGANRPHRGLADQRREVLRRAQHGDTDWVLDGLACDAAVHVAQRVASAGEVVLAGGGGTDMRVGIEAAMTGPLKPHFIIVLTDGYTPWPEQPPGSTRVIAGVIGSNETPPPWITTIRIPTDS